LCAKPVLNSKPLLGPLLRLCRLDLPVTRRGVGFERNEKFAGRRHDLFHRMVEGRLVLLRGVIEAAELAHELQRRGMDLVRRRRRLEMEQGLDIAAHGGSPNFSGKAGIAKAPAQAEAAGLPGRPAANRSMISAITRPER